jgi:hypothetical protein
MVDGIELLSPKRVFRRGGGGEPDVMIWHEDAWLRICERISKTAELLANQEDALAGRSTAVACRAVFSLLSRTPNRHSASIYIVGA